MVGSAHLVTETDAGKPAGNGREHAGAGGASLWLVEPSSQWSAARLAQPGRGVFQDERLQLQLRRGLPHLLRQRGGKLAVLAEWWISGLRRGRRPFKGAKEAWKAQLRRWAINHLVKIDGDAGWLGSSSAGARHDAGVSPTDRRAPMKATGACPSQHGALEILPSARPQDSWSGEWEGTWRRWPDRARVAARANAPVELRQTGQRLKPIVVYLSQVHCAVGPWSNVRTPGSW
jgi:hypothetical protein